MGVMPRAVKIAIMTAAQAVGGEFELCTLFQFTGVAVPTEASVTADFTEATYDGYAPVVSPVWGAALENPDGLVVLTGPTVDSIASGTTVAELVTGWGLKKTAGGLLKYAERFDVPKSMGTFIGQGFSFTPQIVYGS